MEITNEQIKTKAKRIIDDVEMFEDDLEHLKHDMRYMPNERLNVYENDLAHKLFAISKLKIERAWENGR